MKTETLRVRNVVDATRLGAWLRPGEGIGWLAAGTMLISLYRMPVVYLFLACVFCYPCPFLSVVSVCLFFLLLSLELGRCSSDLFLSSRPRRQPRIVLGMVEARSVNMKNTTTTVYFAPHGTVIPPGDGSQKHSVRTTPWCTTAPQWRRKHRPAASATTTFIPWCTLLAISNVE